MRAFVAPIDRKSPGHDHIEPPVLDEGLVGLLGIAGEHGAIDEVILRRRPDGIEPKSD
jgi:hypothetical protein